MDNNYKIIISNKTLYKEFEIPTNKEEITLGTDINCLFRLYKDLFFESVKLTFVKNKDIWSIFCSDNIYISTGDSRKLMSYGLNPGDLLTVRYQSSNSLVFTIEILLDFDNAKRNYERQIDILNSGNIYIGTSNHCQIKLNSKFVQNDIYELKNINNEIHIHTIDTTYGVYYNGIKATTDVVLKNMDFFSVSDFVFYYKDNALWTEIRDDLTINGLTYFDHKIPENYPRFVRNTMAKIVVNDEKITILDPPEIPKKAKSNLLLSLLPSIGMLLTSGLMASMGGRMIIFSMVSGGMAILTAILTAVQSKFDFKKESKERIEKYNKYIDNKTNEIIDSQNKERATLESIYINQQKEKQLVEEFSSDLFDRRLDDKEFLKVRLGTGKVKAIREIEYKKQERLEIEDDLQELPEKLSKKFSILENAPVICDFNNCNSIGIIGEESNRFSMMKNIVLDICVRHYYTDVQLFFISEEKHLDKISWLRYLPYVYNDATGFRNIAYDIDSKNKIFDFLYMEISRREKADEKECFRHLVVFFYDLCGFDEHPISKFKNKLKDINVTFVFFSDKKGNIPLGCSSLIFLNSNNLGYLMDVKNKDEKTEFVFDPIDTFEAKKIVDVLSPIYSEKISLESSLTKNISLFEVLNILEIEDLNLKYRWSSSKVYKSMAAPIGMSKNGVVSLDLHDKAHGPHGLVAGTTGSGKSEILQSYILSIATLFHPYEISFVIIDFKGGGMVNQFKNLPHLLGAITNIDGKEIDRSLKSIKAELQKRQRLFAKAEVNHIDKYIKKYKSGDVTTPIPHLVLIVDEFAELKSEQPDFMKELISTARIGRSLGVHLILATQKPSGQVDDQIWSNSKFKLCLKVQSQEDSNEVLKSPLAAEIKEPGRAYLQVGNNEIFELFQSAYSGAPEKLVDANIKEYTLYEVSYSGQRTTIFQQKREKKSKTNITQLESIVKYVNNYCQKNNIHKLPSICLPSLLSILDYPQHVRIKQNMIGIGLYDDPDNQIQETAYLDFDNKNTFIIGSSQSGKTNMLQGLIRTIASSYTANQANIYILDFGSMVLKNFESLNHVGGVVCSSDDEKLKNLFKLLLSEISMRKEKLLMVNVSSFSSYLEAGYTDLPHIYLFIDNLASLIELYLEDDDRLLNVIREGIAVGISTIITNPQTTGIGYRYLSNFANKIAFHCNDSTEYGNVFDYLSLKPDDIAGRCIFEQGKRILECQTYLSFSGEKEIDRVHQMQEFIFRINEKNKGIKAKSIPFIPTVLSEESIKNDYKASFNNYNLPIGVTYNDVKPFYLNLSRLGIMGLCGKENTGHKNFIQYILKSLELNKTLYPARVVIFDDINRKFDCYKDSSIIETYSLNIDDVSQIISEWYSILNERYDNLMENGSIGDNSDLLLMIVQNNDIAKKINDDFDLMEKFIDIVAKFRDLNVAFIFSNYQNTSLPYDAPEPLRMIKQQQHLIYFDDLENLKPFEVPYEDLKANRKRLEKGDAYYIEDNIVTKLKIVKCK